MSKTYRLALTGAPIAHSRSPAIQETALRLAGLEGSYELFETDTSGLDGLLDSLRTGELTGLNVTMPLKEPAAGACDRLTPEARSARSVNCLRFSGAIEGHSTDQVAFSGILGSPPFDDGPVLVLGSGGSARAAMSALGGRTVYISARNEQTLGLLAGEFGAQPVEWGAAVAGALVINATPLGMAGEEIEHSILQSAGSLIDLPYASGRTHAVAELERSHRPVIDGYEFLARTAMASFTWWTGVVVELEPLIEAARNG